MFQRFNEDTLISRFIQNLMYNTYIPKYKSVWEGSYIVQNCYYIYHKAVIKCLSSGIIGEDAKFDSVIHFDINNPDYTFMFNRVSSNNYYNTDIHEHLGNYLRYLKYNENLDLMPFYNCFSARYTSNFSIRDKRYYEGVDSSKQVVLIPILYNREYTIAVDCEGQLELLPVVLADMSPLSTVYRGELISPNTLLKKFYQKKVKTSFKHPFTFSIDLRDSSLNHYASVLEQNSDGLYLALQMSVDNTSSIVVLEGNYLDSQVDKHFDMTYVQDMSQEEIDNAFISELSLLRLNDKNSYAFSDRLIEYLLLNVIDSSETLDGNIRFIQDTLGMNVYENWVYRGVWTDNIRYDAFNSYKSSKNRDYRLEMIDINGFIDKDMESFLLRGGSNAL